MKTTKKILELNQRFYQMLQVFPQPEDRESFIQKIDSYLTEREHLISILKSEQPIAQEKEVVQEIIRLNNSIDQLLMDFFKQIEADLRITKQQKLTNNKYNEQQATLDGMFFDKRK